MNNTADTFNTEDARREACVDCYIAVANADYTGMDDDTAERVAAAVAALPPFATVGDDITDFGTGPCEVCGSRLAGSRHEVFA